MHIFSKRGPKGCFENGMPEIAHCLAAVLKEALPDATHLVLAFDARAHVSPGTARTVAESFRLGRLGGRVRRNGVIEEVPLAHSRRSVDFAVGSCCR